jgi:hypothetical protein
MLMRIGRWLITLGVPLTVGMMMALSSPVTAGASNGASEQMSAVTGAAWSQCASGNNQYQFGANVTNKCFSTPAYQNNETGWWWCSIEGADAGYCGCYQGCYSVNNAWFDYYGNWITNTSNEIGSFGQNYCCGNVTGGGYQDYYKVFGP